MNGNDGNGHLLSHSHSIHKYAQQKQIAVATVDSRATEKQLHRKLEIDRRKIKILKTPFTKL